MKQIKRKLEGFEFVFAKTGEFRSANFLRILHVSGPFTEDILRKAIQLAQTKHPLLRAKIKKVGNNYQFDFNCSREIPVRFLQKQKKEEWIKIAEEELNNKIDQNTGPLARVTFLSSSNSDHHSDLIITLHHTIGDGISASYLADDILKFCQKIDLGEAVSIEELLAFPSVLKNPSPKGIKGFGFLISFIIREFLRVRSYKPRIVKSEAIRASGVLTRIVHRRIENPELHKILNRTKIEKASMQGTLCSAFFMAMLNTPRDVKEEIFSCSSFINLRNYYDPPVNHHALGCFINAYQHLYKVSKQTPFWDLARYCRKEISKFIKKGDLYCLPSLLKPILNVRMASKKIPITTGGVTNTGMLAFPEHYGPFRMLGMHGSAAFIPGFGIGCIVSAATLKDFLFLNFVFAEPFLSKDWVEQFADHYIENLLNASN